MQETVVIFFFTLNKVIFRFFFNAATSGEGIKCKNF